MLQRIDDFIKGMMPRRGGWLDVVHRAVADF